MNLIKKYITILVPKLLDSEVDDQGHTFITIKYIYNIKFKDIGEEYQKSALGQRAYIFYKKYKTYTNITNKNVNNFIINFVLL